MGLAELRQDLKRLSNPAKAKLLAGFFKTGKGHYGEGDVFLGIQVPYTRAVARCYPTLTLKDVAMLLASPIHEERLAALLVLVNQYEKGSEESRNEIFRFYVKNAKQVNNWDLVDLSAPKIVGKHLLGKGKKGRQVLARLAKSESLWERRIAIVSTYVFIRNGRFSQTFTIAEILLKDSHDLIHKAVGWMLREVGKRDKAAEEKFLQRHYREMPRTMLRYAIERFSPMKRKSYLAR